MTMVSAQTMIQIIMRLGIPAALTIFNGLRDDARPQHTDGTPVAWDTILHTAQSTAAAAATGAMIAEMEIHKLGK
jgi:hypothetical protein